MFHRYPKSVRRGLTMAEIVVSTAIVGVMTVAALESVNMVYRTRRENANRLTGPGLAQELMAEVLAMPYEDPQNPGGAIGIDAGESSSARSTFDDVDDYNVWTSSDTKLRDGSTAAGYSSWQQQVRVAFAGLANPSSNSGSDTGLKRITVTVTSPQNVATTLVALRARRGSLEQPQGVTDDAVTWLGVTLKVGNGTKPERWGVAPINPAADAN
jgi:hypothetical protein